MLRRFFMCRRPIPVAHERMGGDRANGPARPQRFAVQRAGCDALLTPQAGHKKGAPPKRSAFLSSPEGAAQ
jgi:hypothetical protein